MGSNNGNGRDKKQGRRDPLRGRKRLLGVEALEQRALLADGPPVFRPTTNDLNDIRNGPLAVAGADLIKIYQEYQAYTRNPNGPFRSTVGTVRFDGNSVGISVRGFGDRAKLIQDLRVVGMRIEGAVDQSRTIVIEGLLPIDKLPTVVGLTGIVGLGAIYTPITRVQGIANNQADAALRADTARATFGVDGRGTTVGVLSDSVNRVAGGLSDSIASGDLPPMSRINVLLDGAAGQSDEGRAMLEHIYDIAPGANLAYNTATTGQVGFAAGIRNLAAAGSQVIVDDIFYFDEPFFQDGIVAQAITDVTRNRGVTYFSAAGNSGDNGYSSPFRGVTTNVAGIGQGRFFNFNPGGSTAVTTIQINELAGAAGRANLVLQWDDPFYTQSGVNTDLNVFVLDAAGAVVYSGLNNNIATQTPIEIVSIVAPGTYTIVVQVVAGPDPGRISFFNLSGNTDVINPFGSTGGVTMGTSFGHSAVDEAIGVGAVPFFGAPPFFNPSPIRSEPFSSFGPNFVLFNPDGSSRTPMTRLSPVISAPDGGQTTFFGQTLDTSNPAPGQPATPTNVNIVANANIRNFFGTSAAAPNLAAVAALMRQIAPTSTSTDIRKALIATARPLNGAAPGVWDPQGGFGLADAVAAVGAVDQLRVTSIIPGGGQTVTSAPGFITVTFSKAVNVATLDRFDLVVTGPAGVQVVVGTPVAVGNPASTTVVQFPIAIIRPAGTLGNGTFTASILAGSVFAQDGRAVVGASDAFTLADTSRPRITNTSFNGRQVQVTFDSAIDPATVNAGTFLFLRTNNPQFAFDQPSNINISADPRVRVTYNPATFTATIDLSALDQTSFPTDRYALLVLAPPTNAAGLPIGPGVTDTIGNPLDGSFNNVFPSGDGDPRTAQNPSGRSPFESFFQDLGVRSLTGPVFNSVALAPSSDTGIKGDQNTAANRPAFVGQVGANFLGSVANLLVIAQFNGLNNGRITLTSGANGRGFAGEFNATAITDAAGRFTIQAPAGLPDGFNRVRFLVIGQADSPPLPGFSTALDLAFRVDTTTPRIDYTAARPSGASLPQNARISSLTNLSLFVFDPIQPTALNSPFAVPTQLSLNALDPTQAGNVSNYSLFQLVGNTTVDRSSFIMTATFVSTTNRRLTSDPYTGRVDLTFGTGLPEGRYLFVAHTNEPGFAGLQDSAGVPLAADSANPGVPRSYTLAFDFQPLPVYITGVTAIGPDGQGTGPRSYYEVASPVATPRAPAPPSQFVIDFSNPLREGVDYSNLVQLVASADAAGGATDGSFGDFGITNTSQGYSRVNPAGTRVDLVDSIGGAQFGQPGFKNRLVLSLPAGFTLPADYYRLYLPNQGANSLFDQFNNQLDGEFLGDKTASGQYETLLPNGQYRQGISGDAVAGGSFVTGYTVVPNGNVLFARPDYQDDPFLSSDDPDGSIQRPYAVLAPQAAPNALNGGNLNAASNFGTGFNGAFDRAGTGRFDRSVLFAAQQLSARGPVIVVALPGTPIRDPQTGVVTQRTFVLQAPAGTNPLVNDASVSIPALTTLVFSAGSTLKMQNAALFVQNQGSALQLNGGASPTNKVTITSYADDLVGGDTNRDRNSSIARGGDYGGIVFRNFDQTNRSSLFQGQIRTTGVNAVDGRLKGPGGADAVSGADPVLSVVDNAVIRFAGGAVPATIGTRFDAITLINSRPAITNTDISQTGGPAGSQAAISGNLDSFREDEVARGPLIRRVNLRDNSLNGIFVRAELSGVTQPTNAVNYPFNPSNLGGARNFTFDDPYPYLLVSRMDIGSTLLQETGGSQGTEPDRVYIQPGMMFKMQPGAGIDIRGVTQGNQRTSLNIGDRTYLNAVDANPGTAPVLSNGQADPTFRKNTVGDARVLFTSIFDNAASTSFFDPVTLQTTQIVAPLDSSNSRGQFQPTPGNVPTQARWGGISIVSPAAAVIDEVEIRYGGGFVNTATGTETRHAVELGGGVGVGFFGSFGTGTRVSFTNNDMFDNQDVPINIAANGLFAGDPLRPLQSGNPFFRGNVFLRNGVNGLGVMGVNPPTSTVFFRQQPAVTVNSVWDDNDLVYILRSTIAMGPFANSSRGTPDPTQLAPQPRASVTLTVQATLPDTILANGERVGRPGETSIVKMLGAGRDLAFTATPNILAENSVGAGFITGHDNGVDPDTDSLVDIGVNSQIRFLGIGGNETTGQQRVPVILTSINDSTVGRTIRGVTMNQAIDGNTTAPAAGDWGNIVFGSNTLTDYNLYDPRDGNLIDNADIRFASRIEQIGGGLIDLFDANGDNGFTAATDNTYRQKIGLPLTLGQTGLSFANQFNQPLALTVSNSNLSTFRDIGFLAQPGFAPITTARNYAATPPTARGGIAAGQATHTFLLNNTFANMPTAVEIRAALPDSATSFASPAQAVLLNNTFFANGTAFNTTAPARNNMNAFNHVNYLAMNNIFANTTGTAVRSTGQHADSQLQYNLFFGNAVDTDFAGVQDFAGNNFPINGNPQFRDPANGNFNLNPTSAAIDAARSEIGPLPVGDMLFPAVTQVLDATGGIRNTEGRNNPSGGLSSLFGGFFGGFFGGVDAQDFVTLPGFPIRSFADQFVPALPGSPGAVAGPSSNPATFHYAPIAGERDTAGFLRQDNTGTPNVGFGSRPFFDIGAFEFRALFPPHVIGVQASFLDPSSPIGVSARPIYQVGGISGTNQSPLSIQIQFDGLIDVATLSASSIILEASGGDGQFGNGNSANDRAISLAGRLVFDPISFVLTINLSNTGLVLSNDQYRIRVLGSGTNVVRDPNGNALDGENLDATGAQRPLPSGDSFPGGNFVVNFTVDSSAPSVVAGSFFLDTTGDTNYRDGITATNLPTFTGRITDVFPPSTFLQGQTVIIDVDSNGDGVFDILNAGTGTTDATGRFVVTLTTPIPDSPYNVGPDGILAFDYTRNPFVKSVDDTGYAIARVRVIDQSGNVTGLPNESLASYIARGAVAGFVVDTRGPRITAVTPGSGTLATVVNGQVQVTVTFDENVDPQSLNANSIRVVRSGGDGIFNNGNDVVLTVAPGSFVYNYLRTSPLGPESVRFGVTGTGTSALANDVFSVSLLGSGGNAVRDIAGNALDGEFTGTFPSGNGQPGGDFNPTFIVFSPSLISTIFVGPNVINPAAALGTRFNPHPTIAAGLNVAVTGDVVAVLPGVYNESVVLKSLVSLVSAASTSTDGNVQPGDPLQTIIRPFTATGTTIAVTGTDLASVRIGGTLNTELRGFTIAGPLLGNATFGSINPNAIGLNLVNSDILVDRNYFIDAGIGVLTIANGAAGILPRFENNGVIGNLTGITIDARGASGISRVGQFANNTIAFNDLGMRVLASPVSNLPLANVANTIFWQNHDLTPARTGAAIGATAPGAILVRNNLFSGNGPSQTNPGDDTQGNLGFGFNPANLRTTGPDGLGNFLGDPAFVAPRDPRPGGDGPTFFFNDANFDLTLPSAAIDRALPILAPAQDFRYRNRATVAGRAFPGTGPADVGAFEFSGAGGGGGLAAGGQVFRVATSSIMVGGVGRANGAQVPASDAPAMIFVSFSHDVNRSTVSPNDLVISGDGLDSSNPVKATSLSWVDDHTVAFNLSGGYNRSGSVFLGIPANAVSDRNGRGVAAFTDAIRLVPLASPVAPTTAPQATVVSIPQIAPATPAPTNGRPVVVAPIRRRRR